MEFQDLLLEENEGICRITLNRPKVLNALSPRLIRELKQAIEYVAQNKDCQVMIVQGAGRAFSAGVDLQAMNESIQGGQFSSGQILDDGVSLIHTMQSMAAVSIAQVHGFCFTGAMELMMAFDLIYASEDAKIGDTHSKWGIAPKWGMTQRLPQLVGILKAREMSFTAEPVLGSEAARIGLVNRAYPAEQLSESVEAIAQKICSNSAQTIAGMKKLYHQGSHTTLKEGLQIEYDTSLVINDREEFLREFKQNKK